MKPNLIYIVPDEFRPYSMGFLGKEKVKTPNLDRFSKEGTTCTNVVSNFPVCSPYRAMLFSGKYPHENGVMTNCNSATDAQLREDLYCLPDLLSDNGYETGYIGKWHLQKPRPGDELHGEGYRNGYDGNVWDSYTPPGRGRHSFSYWYSYGCCDDHNNPHYWTGESRIDERIDVEEWSAIHETDVALDYIKNRGNQRDDDKPFALFLAWNPPHMPFDQVPRKYTKLYDKYSADELLTWENLTEEGKELASPHIKNYYSMISGIDDQFGRIIKALEEQGLDENTIVIFTSDHGEMMGSHGLMNKNVWYNESTLVPFLIRYPGKIREGVMDDMLFSTIDHYRTIAGLMGLGEYCSDEIKGMDVSERVKTGEGEVPESALYIYYNGKNCTDGRRGIKTDRYTLVFEKSGQDINWYCYDNLKDPSQLNNIYENDDKRDNQLKEELRRKLIEADDPFAGYCSMTLNSKTAVSIG